jgi:predicted porin
MKKSLVALAALAVAGVASAQSSVTLFGVVDATVNYLESKSIAPAGGTSKNTAWNLTTSGYNSSRIGFRGTEDLGGGLAASFWLEAGISNDNGSIGGTAITSGVATTSVMFNRRSTVSLSGGFGELRIGRDYTPTFWNDTVFDPFGTNGVGTNVLNSNPTGDQTLVRASNSIGYFLPANLGGFYGQAMYVFSENVDNNVTDVSKAGEYYGGRFGYANGPLDVALAYGQATAADVSPLPAGRTDVTTTSLGASYDFGVVKLFGEYKLLNVENDATLDNDIEGFLLGATVPVGAGLIRVAYSQAKQDALVAGGADPKAEKFAIGYVHNLSKRTALYATYAYLKHKNGGLLGGAGMGGNAAVPYPAGTPDKGQGYDFGIRHAFCSAAGVSQLQSRNRESHPAKVGWLFFFPHASGRGPATPGEAPLGHAPCSC